ncbi:iron-containing alcohol dehydrogenase [Paenibacillus sp. FA6]|uniref:iron-containing alcohol dehydrogenase n=1 Tax=Paenibacillus sp. FA6 TaxID=3413029 RepID=UPI003F656C71
MDFTFKNPIRFYFGKDSLPNLSKELLKANAKKALLVYGANSLKESGNYDKITANLKESGILWFDFGGNSQPSLERIEEGIKFCKENDIQAVIGIGGATCIDMAKVIGYGVKNDNVWDELSKLHSWKIMSL